MPGVYGTEKIEHNLRKAADDFLQRAARALYEEAKIDMAKAKSRTPVDTGQLKASGIVNFPRVTRNNVSVLLTFGTFAPSSKYAIYVHENLHAKHRVGQAKFLESVIIESRSTMLERVAARMNKK